MTAMEKPSSSACSKQAKRNNKNAADHAFVTGSPPVANPSDDFLFHLSRTHRRWRKLLDERLKKLGVTPARWATLLCLHQSGDGITQRELANLMSIENPTLVRLLDSLEQQGLIERRPCVKDRRARRLHMTPSGQAYMVQLSQHSHLLRGHMLKSISEKDMETTLRVLNIVLNNADALAK